MRHGGRRGAWLVLCGCATLVTILAKYPDVRIELSGHTDSSGTTMEARSNPSCLRPNSVKRYLVMHGIEGARILARGAGPDEPLESNKTAAGRAKNRRIEMYLLEQR